MNGNRMKDVLEDIARRGVPENTNLWPEISAQFERKSPIYILRARPVVATLIALLILLSLSGVAYAIGRSLGYFPGLGLVDQNAPFQVLPEPISQTREGVTITIKQATLNADQMSVTLLIENIPTEKRSFWVLPDSKQCMSNPELHLTDGQVVKLSSATMNALDDGYESQLKFSSIPMGIMDMTLFIPCIQTTRGPNILPENWELPLRFVPASPQLVSTIIPVKEIPTVTQTAPTSYSATTGRLSILQVIDTGDAYILVGAFTPPAPSANEKGIYAIADEILTDSNGQVIEWQPAIDLDLTSYIIANRSKDVWALKVTKNFVSPLHITYRTQYLYSPVPQDAYTFEFDAGPNPQAGQEWNVNQEFQLAGHTLTLDKITAGAGSYTFFFHTKDPSVESLGINSQGIQIEGYTPVDFGGYELIGSWTITKIYSEMPRGKLKITFSEIYLYGNTQDWTMNWQP
jgi:hypothetical protein